MTIDSVSQRARALATALEAVAAQVYFAPEAHAAYERLGFDPSRRQLLGAASPDPAAYFTSRGAVMGQVAGEVVAAAFGVFNPAIVVPFVAHGWSLTDAATIEAARASASVAQLERVLGGSPNGIERAVSLLERATAGLRLEGRPLFAGVVARGVPASPLGALWRYTDRLREYRGDSHINAFTAAGLDAVEIGLLSEPYFGMRHRSYIRSRAWGPGDLDAGVERLATRGLLVDGALTEAGRTLRETVEVATDEQCRPIVDAVGDDLDELVGLLGQWSAALVAVGAYPTTSPRG